jgi:hypothetical protein
MEGAFGICGFRRAAGAMHVPEQVGEIGGGDGRLPVSAGASGVGFLGLGVEGAVLDDRADEESVPT